MDEANVTISYNIGIFFVHVGTSSMKEKSWPKYNNVWPGLGFH